MSQPSGTNISNVPIIFRTIYGAALDTELTVEAFKMRVSSGTNTRLQFASTSSLALINGTWAGTTAVASVGTTFNNTGAALSATIWTDYNTVSLTATGNTILLTFLDTTNSRLYRVLACKTGSTTAAITAERLI